MISFFCRKKQAKKKNATELPLCSEVSVRYMLKTEDKSVAFVFAATWIFNGL